MSIVYTSMVSFSTIIYGPSVHPIRCALNPFLKKPGFLYVSRGSAAHAKNIDNIRPEIYTLYKGRMVYIFMSG